MSTNTLSTFDLLVNQVQERTFSDEELRNMPVAFRKYVAAKNGIATAVPPGFELVLRGRTITIGDKNAAVRLLTQSKTANTSSYRDAAHLNTTGGSIHYTPEVVRLNSLNGTTIERANSVIPAHFGTVEQRDNVQAVAAVVAQLVTVKQASWENNVPINTWAKVLTKDGGMDASGLSEFAETAKVILNNTKAWQAKDTIGRNACTGLEAVVFIRNQLDLIEKDEYDLINTRLVYNVLRPFEYEVGNWYERLNGEVPIVPATSYKEVIVSDRCARVLKAEGFPVPYWYYGGYAPKLQLPSNTGRMKETLERHQKMMEIQVGNESCTALLSGMRGFSGLTDDFGKRMQFTIAAVLSAFSRGRDVDIQLYSVGDIVMLENSITKWKVVFKYTLPESDPSSPSYYSCRYIIPSPTEMSKIPPALKSYCIYAPRVGTVLINWNGNGLPTSSEKNVAVDYRSCAQELIPSIWRDNDFIMHMPVYDDVFFPKTHTDDDQVKATLVNKSNGSPNMPTNKKSGVFVYSFGTASTFRGIVSTIPDLTLVGFGYSKTGALWDMKTAEKLVHLTLDPVKTFSNWLKKVSIDCATQMVTFLFPVSRYSPISNLPYMSRKGVTLVMDSIEQEDGKIIKNFQAVQAKVRRGRQIGKEPESEVSAPTNLTGIAPVGPIRVRVPIGATLSDPNSSMTSEEVRKYVEENNDENDYNDDEDNDDGQPQEEEIPRGD